MTQKDHAGLKKVTFFGLLFKLKHLSWLNSSSIWSNKVLTSGAKIQMSYTYKWQGDKMLITKTLLHQPADAWPSIWQAKRHMSKYIQAWRTCSKCGLFDVKFCHSQLQVSLHQVERSKTLQLCTTCSASSMWGNGNACQMVMEFNFL